MKRPTTYCETCRSTVYADDIHSCYDFDAVERHRALERAVVEKAKAYEARFRELMTEGGSERSPSFRFPDLCAVLDVAGVNTVGACMALASWQYLTLLYIDARIDEKASGDIQDVVRTIHLRDDLISAAVAAAEPLRNRRTRTRRGAAGAEQDQYTLTLEPHAVPDSP